MDPKNKKQVDIDTSVGIFPVVKENDTCPYWDSAGEMSLTPMRECWYCKFSDFRKETKEHQTHSICHYPKNRI